MLAQVQRRVGDVDRVVVRGDLAAVLARLVEDDVPRLGRRLDLVRVVHQQVRAAAVRHAVHLAVDAVELLVLEGVEDVLVVRDQVGVDRVHVAALDQARGGVAGGGDAVVLAGPHQLHHLVRGVADLDVDLAAGLLLEVRHPVDLRVGRAVLDVAGPGDEVHLALALAELGQRLVARRLLGVIVASASGREGQHEGDEPRRRMSHAHRAESSSLVLTLLLPFCVRCSRYRDRRAPAAIPRSSPAPRSSAPPPRRSRGSAARPGAPRPPPVTTM